MYSIIGASSRGFFFATAIASLLLPFCLAWGQEKATVIPPPTLDNPVAAGSSQKAVLAGGCYWGTQGVFEHVVGVKSVVAGFTAGHSDEDGGAESVMITFDPGVISYGQLLQILFSVVHDPTQMNRQGPDVGPGYRSDIFYVDDTQKRIAQAYIAQLNEANVFPSKIVTRIDRFQHFDPAGPAQQDFMIKNLRLQYVVVNDLPKLTALQELFPAQYQDRATRYRE